MLNVATQRVVALVDMDCFYCQVETRLNPSLKDKPVAVVQYNQWKGGGIIAVNYEARDRGVTRYMRGEEAKEKCPEISLVSVPTVRGKADLSNYRDAGDEVASIISEFSDCVQRASIDEAYLDLTKAVQEYIKSHDDEIRQTDLPNTYVVGHCDLKNKNEEDRLKGTTEWLEAVENEKTKESPDYQLAVGAIIVERMRAEILRRTGFHCSAGIAHNKILAKLTAGLHKPKKQTVLPQDGVPELYETLPIYKVRNLGGKLGKQVAEKLSIKYMSELFRFSLGELLEKFDEKTGNWLYNMARGIDVEPVTSRLRPESIGCCKNFPGKNALGRKSEVEHWLRELATEISERLLKDLERNKRRAKLLTVSFSQETSMSRCGALSSYDVGRIVQEALDLLKKFNAAAAASEDIWSPPIKYLGLSASKFKEESASIEKYFKHGNNGESSKKAEDSSFFRESIEGKDRLEKRNKPAEIGNGFFKDVEKGNCKGKEETTNEELKPSFFLKYLSTKSETNPGNERKGGPPAGEDDVDEGEAWISLSEVFPDPNEAEPEVVESLPEALQHKFREKLRSLGGGGEGNSSTSESVPQNPWRNITPATEICPECSKKIPKTEMLVHSDYHAALKLSSEINKPPNNAVGVSARVNKPKETESKRKKKKVATPSKKMKSLTAFFAPLTKE